jgi:hypothetical protein
MRRREFIALLGGTAAAWPLAARGQHSDRMLRVGVLLGLAQQDPEAINRVKAFRLGMRDLGWIEGRNVQIDYRFAGNNSESINKNVTEWHQWFAANGLEAPAIHGMRFDRSFLAIAMASSGLGVTLESTRLAEGEIATGKLVAPLAGRSVDVRYIGHYLVFPRAASQRRAVRVFADWIISELTDKS